MSRETWKYLYWIGRLILGGVFIYASVDKIAHPDRFAEIVYNYKLMPTEAVNIVAIFLPWVEMLSGVLLVIGRWPLAGAVILTGLLLVFSVAIGFNLARGLDFQCGCFATSASAKTSNILTLVRDIVFLIPAWICLRESYARAKARIG